MKRNKIISLILFALIVIGGFAGCDNKASVDTSSQSSKETKVADGKREIRTKGNDSAVLEAPSNTKELPGDKERFDSYVYSVDKLKADADKVVIIDARSKEDYDKGHIPNAVQAAWQDWANMDAKQDSGDWAKVLPNDKLSAIFGKLGIDGTKPVVIYNDPATSWGDEGRQLWTLRLFGLNNTYILNGGTKAWTEAGGELTKEKTNVKEVKGPTPKPNNELIVDTKYVANNLGKVNILDVREDEERAGTKNYGEASKGRIPESKHIWFKDFYNKDGKLLTPAQIRARVEAKGFKTSDEVITYCTGGIRSGFAAMMLQAAGYTKAKNYNVSFSAWAGTKQKIDSAVLKELD
ncbi:sulfurtransferase [Clostridium cylindrosporum]|uniref:thiosulfate sulfurtransferase n=1 Tax=Clostridium cylindrosporum DSM 605 TaxID=1121307 RepID=A0A0J8G4F9_CLOCY|nr:rhodanese-like domain-containing protein [Clostridium cylindrosporum]KMT22556.1 sulfurtransferase [Clostridium cylindrosporum DSM 605]